MQGGPLADAFGELPRRAGGPEVVEVDDAVGEPVGGHAQQPRPETVREPQPGQRVGTAALPGVGVGPGNSQPFAVVEQVEAAVGKDVRLAPAGPSARRSTAAGTPVPRSR